MKKKKKSTREIFSEDNIKAIDAKYEAQKIAFAPLVFQANRSLITTGILHEIDEAGEIGVSYNQLSQKLNLESYTLKVLIEMGLSSNVIKLAPNDDKDLFVLGKIGYFLLHDPMTKANLNFTHDVCYKGSFFMDDSLEKGKPEGLKVFGEWPTIYEGLSKLEPEVQKSWFDFDHYYSDTAFPSALKYVFGFKPKKLMDIGGNTGKWSFACANYDDDVNITIVDLPGQAAMVRKHIEANNRADRISVYESDMLKKETKLPSGHDAVWMSQFLDCFSLNEVTAIMEKIHEAIDENAAVYVMEPLWDKQNYPAAVYSLHATSLYFTTMANGNSKMYGFDELVEAICKPGFELVNETHTIGPNDYSILRFKKN